MLNEIVYPALIRLARAFPPGLNSRPNSFSVVNSLKDVASYNLNATIRSARTGQYWGRRWELSGEDSSQIQYENSLVFVRPETISFTKGANRLGNEACKNIEVGIASIPECDTCPQSRTDTEIELDNALVLNKITSELLMIAPYNVNIQPNLGGIGLSTYWLLPSEVSWLKVNGVVFPSLGKCDAYLSIKKTTDNFSSFDYGTDGTIITTAKLGVCWCDTTAIGYDFSVNEFKQAAYVGCTTC